MWILLALAAGALIVLVVANLSSSAKKIEHEIEHLYRAGDPQFVRSMGSLLGPGDRAGKRGARPLQRRRDLPRHARRDPRARRARSASRPSSTGRATIGREFADALGERARAGVKVHVLLDWVGSGKMDAVDAARR